MPVELLSDDAFLEELTTQFPSVADMLSRLDEHDETQAVHTYGVYMITMGIARRSGIPEEYLYIAGLGALLHDIGKLYVDRKYFDKVRDNPKSSRKHRRALKVIRDTHVTEGAATIMSIPDLDMPTTLLADDGEPIPLQEALYHIIMSSHQIYPNSVKGDPQRYPDNYNWNSAPGSLVPFMKIVAVADRAEREVTRFGKQEPSSDGIHDGLHAHLGSPEIGQDWDLFKIALDVCRDLYGIDHPNVPDPHPAATS